MTTLHYTVGLPASGKTTFAKQMILDNPRMIRCNRDDLRLMLHDGRFSGGNEKAVTRMQDAMILSALDDGRDVIVDDTNLNDKTVARLHRIADQGGAKTMCLNQFLEVSLWDCIERDLKRERSVGEDVIRKMWERYLAPKSRERTGLPACVIVDVDGTIALNTCGRSPYAWDRVGEDTPNEQVLEMVRQLGNASDLVVVSGRDGICQTETEAWIIKHLGDKYAALFMRPAGDNRPDWVIKNEILHRDILPNWDPILAVDDRAVVCDMWRSEGIEVWQVGHGRF